MRTLPYPRGDPYAGFHSILRDLASLVLASVLLFGGLAVLSGHVGQHQFSYNPKHERVVYVEGGVYEVGETHPGEPSFPDCVDCLYFGNSVSDDGEHEYRENERYLWAETRRVRL